MSTTLAGRGSLNRTGEPQPGKQGWTVPLSAGTAMLVLDIVGLLIVWPLVLAIWNPFRHGAPLVATLLLYPAAAVASFYAVGLYRREAGASLRRAIGRVPLAAIIATIGASAILLFFAPASAVPGVPAGSCVLAVGAWSRLAFDALRRRGLFTRSVLVLGAGQRAWDLVWVLQKEGRTLGYRVTFLHDATLGPLDPRLADGSIGPIIVIGAGGIASVVGNLQPDEIVVAPDERRGMDLHGLLDCKINGYPVSEYLGFLEREARRVDIKRIEVGWLLYSDGFSMGFLDRLLKRALDVSVSLVVLILVSPALIAAMIAIRLQDGGPAFYRQARVTRHGRVFQILKLRTMRVDAEKGGAAWAAVGDARITRLGTLLRRTRLDEVPQLFNVLRGQMSFVGPRPERPEFVEMLAGHLPLYRKRHAAKAGLTGWAQVNYPYGASIDDARSKLSYDLYYVKNFSILFDILIILQTIRVVLWPGNSAR